MTSETSAATTPALLKQALAWLEQDPDPQTRAELQAAVENAKRDPNGAADLASRFDGRLEFGTAGLRGELGAGPNRMNRVLVGQAAAGIANWLLANNEFSGGKPSVVIGFDGRLNSDVFARDSAQIFAAAGIDVLLFDSFVPTPVLAFAVKQGGFSMGVMVTASHNPPRDNGYKVYLGGANGGSQIISPVDSEIAKCIHTVAATKTFAELPKSDDFVTGGAELRDEYVDHTASLVEPQDGALLGHGISVVFTAMHGVGWETLKSAFKAAGLSQPAVVRQQISPDGTFPTVAFPNPEEPGALDLAFETAKQVRAQLILACDPDADRLAVAVPDSREKPGWRKLTGDQVGLILGYEVAKRASNLGITGTLACSIVSSSQLAAVAADFDLGFEQTLTGFKWISKVPHLLFGFEEALGYCVDPEHTPDKDGISAALMIASLANRLAADGTDLDQHLQDLCQRYGYFATGQISQRFGNVAVAQQKVSELRKNPPATIDGSKADFTDLALGSANLKPTDGLLFQLDDGRRVIVRPSGTEPKLKCYLQAIGDSEKSAQGKLAALDAAMRDVLT